MYIYGPGYKFPSHIICNKDNRRDFKRIHTMGALCGEGKCDQIGIVGQLTLFMSLKLINHTFRQVVNK